LPTPSLDLIRHEPSDRKGLISPLLAPTLPEAHSCTSWWDKWIESGSEGGGRGKGGGLVLEVITFNLLYPALNVLHVIFCIYNKE